MDEFGNAGVGKCFEQQVQQINDMVALVRDPNLKAMARMTVSALTVIDVHARDVVDKLFQKGVSSKDEFLWFSQMRYYWEDGEALEGDLKVMMVSSKRPYGYEYLGNSFRLVITPLTDKCYLTLMGALQMTLGGAPAGPAGTGE
jgi:dynein heavy chain